MATILQSHHVIESSMFAELGSSAIKSLTAQNRIHPTIATSRPHP